MIARYYPLFFSFPPSHNIVKGKLLQAFVTSAQSVGASACLTMAVVFVLPEANSRAILLSGNITLRNLLKWSAARIGKLYSLTKITEMYFSSCGLVSQIIFLKYSISKLLLTTNTSLCSQVLVFL